MLPDRLRESFVNAPATGGSRPVMPVAHEDSGKQQIVVNIFMVRSIPT